MIQENMKIKNMKIIFNTRFPQRSIFGFNILSSFHSSIACYLLLFFGKILNLFFGLSKIQILAGLLFNILLDISVVILIMNLILKRNEIRRSKFIFLNLLLFIYFPIALNNIFIGVSLIYRFFINI